MKGSGRASTRLGRCSGGASFPAGHSWLCPGLQEEIQVSVVPVWFIHLQPRHSFGIPSNIPWLSCELREQGAREGRGAHPQPRAQLGAKVQQRLVDHHTCKKFKNQQLLPAGGGSSRARTGCAKGNGSRRLWEAGAGGAGCPVQCQHIRTAARSLCCGLVEFIPCCAPRLYSTVGAAIPFPWDVDIPQEPGSPLRGPGSGWDPPCSRQEW